MSGRATVINDSSHVEFSEQFLFSTKPVMSQGGTKHATQGIDVGSSVRSIVMDTSSPRYTSRGTPKETNVCKVEKMK